MQHMLIIGATLIITWDTLYYFYSLSGNDDDDVQVGVEKTGERYVSCVYRYMDTFTLMIAGYLVSSPDTTLGGEKGSGDISRFL